MFIQSSISKTYKLFPLTNDSTYTIVVFFSRPLHPYLVWHQQDLDKIAGDDVKCLSAKSQIGWGSWEAWQVAVAHRERMLRKKTRAEDT